MWGVIKKFGNLAILLLLVTHLLVISLLMAPASKLLGLAIDADSGYLSASVIPKNVEAFIVKNKIEVKGDYQVAQNNFGRFIFRLLKLKHDQFMDADEQLALDMNLLNYGRDVIGLGKAAQFYYKKPISELTDQEWLTLINLQKIFSEK